MQQQAEEETEAKAAQLSPLKEDPQLPPVTPREERCVRVLQRHSAHTHANTLTCMHGQTLTAAC